MNSTPRVSVIMPVHNGAGYLRPAIESILEQSLIDFEFLVIDDCSSDETVTIVDSFDDNRIHLIRSRHRLKLAGALNLGMKRARGEFLARMDADDISKPKRLELQVEFLSKNEDLGICGSWVELFPLEKKTVQRYPTNKDSVHALSLFHSPFAHPSVMMRRAWFERHDLHYDVSFYPTEDFDLWCRALTRFKGANLGDVLLQYRVHEQSLTGSDWSNMDEQAARITQRALHAMNLPSDKDAGIYHRKIAMAQIQQTTEELHRAVSWLTDIVEANLRNKMYSHAALTEVIDELWFRICMHCATAGPWPVKYFLQQRFGLASMTRYKRFFILTASCLKHYLKKKTA